MDRISAIWKRIKVLSGYSWIAIRNFSYALTWSILFTFVLLYSNILTFFDMVPLSMLGIGLAWVVMLHATRWVYLKIMELFGDKKYGAPGILLKYNTSDGDLSLWSGLQTYEALVDDDRVAEGGVPRCWCGSLEMRDFGLKSTHDHRRVHVCVRCNYGIYRSER